ncbi:hypothetical protein A2477_00485 [Candidatus Falkowbacteria bacterium RIFOXYC2_FULL_47_12]|uniref:DUF948 domain-containing protein n=2 Tax=Candidatus Falkowiibacteriota TaxID=1752728 RepID=A0A1F5TM11_9BACT|nr:MAG: hypothetical protein A2242_00195 [Candidatus Falkowbacteria bacterium RIFOXYA2_FULL_47_9]OGF39847.1 MAG: hypothetical protein A2477_00485 [Candidatus Falkowbacteria bacterium RIFOXYC2_FULL_47_12]
MLQTSADILWITIAVCIALLTLFSCWGIFYIIQIIRRSSKMFKGVEQMIENINDVIKTTKEKIEHSAAYLSILADGVKKVAEIVREQGGGEKKRKK